MYFNYRVLQEAKDKDCNPLFERLKFLAIYSNNLAEFFKVRVAHHKNLYRLNKKLKKEFQIESEKVLKQILKLVNEHQLEFTNIFENEIVPELKENGIELKKRLELSEEQYLFINTYFNDHLLPYVQPMLLVGNKIKPFLNSAALYLAVQLLDKKSGKTNYALVQIPSDKIHRIIILPQSKVNIHDVIFLDDIIRHNIREIFPGYNIIQSYSIKLTRDADLYIDDEFSGDLMKKLKKSLKKRKVGPPARLVYDRLMPEPFLTYLMDVFGLDELDIVPEGRYHNNFDLFKFPDFGKDHLKLKSLKPLKFNYLEDAKSIFKEVKEKDYLINVPYHSYESVIKFFEEAADDDSVTHIKIVQYRVAGVSRIMNALKRAVKKGKYVSAFIELKARFDEEANLRWSTELKEAGVKVHTSFPGIKVHVKLALVIRQTENGDEKFAYLSTGNFHEGTAKLYSDFGMFTYDKRITEETVKVFSFLENKTIPREGFKHLLVGKFNMRQTLTKLVEQEIKNAKKGKEASIFLKMNSIQEPNLIKLLYEASRAGVKIRLIIRGICSIVPEVNKYSENIKAISILDRYLEHARVFIFANDGDEKIYLSSADWMGRNLYRRVETVFPIYDEEIKQTIKDVMNIQWKDNVKARYLDFKRLNTYRRNEDISIQSQNETYYYYKRKLLLDSNP